MNTQYTLFFMKKDETNPLFVNNGRDLEQIMVSWKESNVDLESFNFYTNVFNISYKIYPF